MSMIHLNELRIGNIIMYVPETGIEKREIITGILKDRVMLSDDVQPYPLSSIKPIPVTTEILKDSGFIFTGDDWYELNSAFGKFNYNIKYKVCSVSDKDYANECMLNEYGTIKYIHQLQNICFWISGKELNINF
jgi:hypothetical protein